MSKGYALENHRGGPTIRQIRIEPDTWAQVAGKNTKQNHKPFQTHYVGKNYNNSQ